MQEAPSEACEADRAILVDTSQDAPLLGLAGFLAEKRHAHSILWSLLLAVTASRHCTAYDTSALRQQSSCLMVCIWGLSNPLRAGFRAGPAEKDEVN